MLLNETKVIVLIRQAKFIETGHLVEGYLPDFLFGDFYAREAESISFVKTLRTRLLPIHSQ